MPGLLSLSCTSLFFFLSLWSPHGAETFFDDSHHKMPYRHPPCSPQPPPTPPVPAELTPGCLPVPSLASWALSRHSCAVRHWCSIPHQTLRAAPPALCCPPWSSLLSLLTPTAHCVPLGLIPLPCPFPLIERNGQIWQVLSVDHFLPASAIPSPAVVS